MLANRMDELERINAFLEECAVAWKLPARLVLSLNLAIEEAFTNIVQNAYTDNAPHDILLEIETRDNELVMTVTDDGIPYDPTKRSDPDIGLSAEERPVGGLGIFLINQTMDKVSYVRSNDKNQLTMTKNIKP